MASQERADPAPVFGAAEVLCSGLLDSANGEMLSFFMVEKCLGVIDQADEWHATTSKRCENSVVLSHRFMILGNRENGERICIISANIRQKCVD